MFSRINKDEQGIAIVTAAVVSMVILLLCIVVIQVSIHNSERSGQSRRRVQAVDAAEAGIDYYFSYLTATGGVDPQCQFTQNMQGSPGSFTVTAYYWNGVNSVPCVGSPPRLTGGVTPDMVMLYSEGKSGAATPVRKMQAYAKLSVTSGSTFDNSGAIFAQSSITFSSNARLGGSQYSDADIYSNGNYSLASNSTIFGKVYAQGSVTLASNAEVKKDVWAAGNITMNSKSTIGKGLPGNSVAAQSSGGSISLSNPATIYGNAKAQGTITGGTVTGTRSPNQQGLSPPPSRTFPTFTYCASGCTTSPTSWATAGYTNQQTFSGATACSDAVNYIRTVWTTGPLLVRIAAPGATCTTTFTGGTTNVPGNLAIISDGPITLNANARFVPSPSSGIYNVFVFGGLSGTAPCNFTANANSGFNPGLAALLYVPATCAIDLLSNSAIAQGQLIGGTINFKHTVAMNFQPLTVPGTGNGGFKQDIKCKREINLLQGYPGAVVAPNHC